LTLSDLLVGSWEQAESSAVEDDGNVGVFAASGEEIVRSVGNTRIFGFLAFT